MSRELENKTIGNDLQKLARILEQNSIINDSSPLDRAGVICSKTATAEKWAYELNELTFGDIHKIQAMGSIIPNDTDDIKVRLTIKINGVVGDSNETLRDPLKDLSFDLEITACCCDNFKDDIKDLHCAWHFDKHIHHDGDNQTAYSHPEYHATFGGSKMEGSTYDYGQTVVMPTPRLAYPPMDAALGIDFILQNYFPLKRIKKILEDSEYKEIIRKSKDRLWKPYFYSIYSHWDKDSKTIEGRYQAHHLFPLLGQ